MGVDYSLYVKIIEIHARAFFKVIIFSIGSVAKAKHMFKVRINNFRASPYCLIVIYLD